MESRVALVTGGMGGIGTAICKELAKNNGKVIASYNKNGDHQTARDWQQEQKRQGYDFGIYYVDVCDYFACKEMIDKIESKYKQIDILVNNAGITRDAQLCKMNLEQWNIVLKTNLDSIFNITRHVIPGMIARQYGRIINISSVNGQKGQFGQVNYSSSKAGIHGFTKSLSREVARKGITVNTISPGYIETKMVTSIPEEILKKIIVEIPVGRLGKPEEIARAVAFLASQNSAYITGSNISVNGGMYLL